MALSSIVSKSLGLNLNFGGGNKYIRYNNNK